MNKPHMSHESSPSGTPRKGIVRAWVEFWFTPIDPIGLHAVRALSGLLFLTWLLGFAGHHEALFSLGGWFDTRAYLEAGAVPDGIPAPISWSILYLAGENSALLAAIYWSSLAVFALFTLGVTPRITGVLTWLLVCSYTANPAISYDGDALLIVLAFYLMVGYLLFGWEETREALVSRLVVSRSALFLGSSRHSVGANVTLRLLQAHFALIVCTSGLHKLQHAEWWAGFTFWYALMPPYETTVEQARAYATNPSSFLSLLSLGAYLTLAWQLSYPFFAWRPRWRLILLGGALIGWIATAFLYRLPLFGPAYLIGSLGFLTPAEWRGAFAWLARLPGLSFLAAALPAAADDVTVSRSRRKVAV